MREDVYLFFKEISKIPRETYHIEAISDYLVEFAKERDLEVYQDKALNVVIKKEASSGYEDREAVILQAHMDMVCQKNKDSNHDFSKDEIEIKEKEGFLWADGTTLGADDGIGVAMILAILAGNYKHPKIEALFTVNEEVGMDGAYQFDMSMLNSNRLINIDSEEEGILTAGCAGGVQLKVLLDGKRERKKGNIITIHLYNLVGGHSGVDIDKKRVNAVKYIMNYIADDDYLISIDGGEVDNAICNGVTVKLLSKKESIDSQEILNSLKILGEKKAKVDIVITAGEEFVFNKESSRKIFRYLREVPNGVISYETDIKNKVCTSLNLGVIKTTDDKVTIKHLIRSSKEKENKKLLDTIYKLGDSVKASISIENQFPEWEYQKDSKLRAYLEKKYLEMFDKKLEIDVTHAGLECGILVSKNKKLDCVSIGPNILDAHTPNERVEIKSVNRVFDYLLLVLCDII